MTNRLHVQSLACCIFLCIPGIAFTQGETVKIHWGGAAEQIYETGFTDNVRKLPSGGVGLFDMELVENDAPGAGKSEKGISRDTIWGANRARKILQVDDPRAHKAFVVLFSYNESAEQRPLRFTVNGWEGQITQDNREAYRWAEFPADALKQGGNVIELYCPEAKSEEEGWPLYLARADEFHSGGGDPARVGKTSFKSTDGGVTWKESPFGEDGATRAEYTVRLSLDRYRAEGALVTPVVDLWRGDSGEFIVPQRRIDRVEFEARADVPEGASVTYYLRRGTSPNPNDDGWEPYEKIGDGPRLLLEKEGKAFNRRYAQLKAVLATDNPLHTPRLTAIHVRAEGKNRVPVMENIFLSHCENPEIRYPSVAWEWEPADRPEFELLKQRENLDELLAGSASQFESQTRLMDHVTKRWWDGDPLPDYPAWDALSILDRIDEAGSGGMCIQHNNVLAGMCIAYGWQARHVNITSHEICEVWSDEYGKWIYLDAHGVNHYMFDKQSGEPQSILDLHRVFLDLYHPDKPIDWMNDSMGRHSDLANSPVGLAVPGAGRKMHNGLDLMAFARMMPRNNYYEKPTPRPLTHGCTWWPWDGYINWYDDRTPPKRQYSHHTDRPQDMWPELNKTRIHATSGGGEAQLFLRFESYTPNFSHYEVQREDSVWSVTKDQWVWRLHPGKNTLKVRAVNEMGVKGKPTLIELNHVSVASH
jgi:hypothetical protein